MEMLLLFLFMALIVSFFSSLFESMLLTIPPSFLETVNKRSGYGKIIRRLKLNVEKPLAAILTLNTVANTIGAAGVGAQAVKLWGDASLGIVSAVLTILILIISEIIPKSLGAYYWKSLVPFATYAIQGYIYITLPFVYLSDLITKLLVRGDKKHIVSRDEIIAMTEIAEAHNSINSQECTVIKNVLSFSDTSTETVMTPRSVLFAAPENITIEEFLNYNNVNAFTRTPVFDKSIDMITGYVHKNDILNKLKDNLRNDLLSTCKRKIITVGEEMSIRFLFEKMVVQKEQIALIIDEFGGTAGIVTMEDIIETLLGIEILDEHDIDTDMQLLARNRYLRKIKT
jgi:CBS domain containing-hemolysin-like protein